MAVGSQESETAAQEDSREKSGRYLKRKLGAFPDNRSHLSACIKAEYVPCGIGYPHDGSAFLLN